MYAARRGNAKSYIHLINSEADDIQTGTWNGRVLINHTRRYDVDAFLWDARRLVFVCIAIYEMMMTFPQYRPLNPSIFII